MAAGDAEPEQGQAAGGEHAPAQPAAEAADASDVPQLAAPMQPPLAQAAAPAAAAPIHSKAFENLVEGPNDIVGLLAYGKFKLSIHEAACNGTVMDRPSRNLTPAMVDVLRSAAEQMIGQVVDDGIQAAAPDIEKSALRTSMEAQFTDMAATIKGERAVVTDRIDQRTSFLPSFLTNLAAWFVTLVIAVVIVYLFNRPSPEQSILNVARPATQQLRPPPAVQQEGRATDNRSGQ